MLGGHDPEVGTVQMLEIDDDLSSLISSDSDEDDDDDGGSESTEGQIPVVFRKAGQRNRCGIGM